MFFSQMPTDVSETDLKRKQQEEEADGGGEEEEQKAEKHAQTHGHGPPVDNGASAASAQLQPVSEAVRSA